MTNNVSFSTSSFPAPALSRSVSSPLLAAISTSHNLPACISSPSSSIKIVRQNNKSPNDRKSKKDWNRGVLKITGMAQQPIHEEPHRPHKNHHGQDANPMERQVFTRMQSPAIFVVMGQFTGDSLWKSFQDSRGGTCAGWVLEVLHQQPGRNRRHVFRRVRVVFVMWFFGARNILAQAFDVIIPVRSELHHR